MLCCVVFMGRVGFCHPYWVPIYLISCLVFIPRKSRCSLLGYFSVFITWCLFQANPRCCHISLFNSYSVSQTLVPLLEYIVLHQFWNQSKLQSVTAVIWNQQPTHPHQINPFFTLEPSTYNFGSQTYCTNYNNQTTHTHHHWVPLYWRRGKKKKKKKTIWRERPAQNQLLSLWKVKTALLWQVTPPAKQVNDHSKHPKSNYTILQEYNNVIFPPLTQ